MTLNVDFSRISKHSSKLTAATGRRRVPLFYVVVGLRESLMIHEKSTFKVIFALNFPAVIANPEKSSYLAEQRR